MAYSTRTQGAKPTAAASAHARTRYEGDVYGWVQEQLAFLRAGRMDALDLDEIAGELNDVGLSEDHRLQSAVEIILLHMLRWDRQPERRSRSWALSIAEHRERALMQLEKSPGLKSSLEEAQRAFRLARLGAARQMKRSLRTFPVDCPYAWDDVPHRPFEYDADW